MALCIAIIDNACTITTPGFFVTAYYAYHHTPTTDVYIELVPCSAPCDWTSASNQAAARTFSNNGGLTVIRAGTLAQPADNEQNAIIRAIETVFPTYQAWLGGKMTVQSPLAFACKTLMLTIILFVCPS